MKIESISITNLNNIYNLIKETKDYNRTNFYLHDMGRILRKSSVTIEFSEINGYELLFLGKYNILKCEKIRSYDISTISPNNIDIDIRNTTVKLSRLLEFIMKDDKIYFENNMLPLCYDLYNVTVEFVGNNISVLYKYNIDEWFNDDMTELDEAAINTINTKIAGSFIENFYLEMYKSSSNQDVASLKMEHALFSKYGNRNDKFVLHQIIGPYGTNVDFINSNQDKLNKQMKVFNTYYDKNNNNKYNFLIECETTLQTMIELFAKTGLVDSYEQLVPLTEKFYVPDEITDKYGSRFGEIMLGYNAAITSTPDDSIMKYMYINNSTYIKYSMLIPFTEINEESKLYKVINEQLTMLNEIGKEYKIVSNGEYQKLNKLVRTLENINIVKF